jgi:hypothetical protein
MCDVPNCAICMYDDLDDLDELEETEDFDFDLEDDND